MLRILLILTISILMPVGVGADDTWEDFQRQKAAAEELAPIPKSGPKLIPKDVIIEQLKNEGQVTYTSDTMLFHFGQSTLKSESMPNLKSLAQALKEAASHPELSKIKKYFVDGHTCNIGSAEFNCKLSWSRSNAVIEHLTNLGVDKDKLVPRGYGLEQPAHSNDSEETRMLNRRVVIKGDSRESSAGQDPPPCSSQEKRISGPTTPSQGVRTSPSLEEVAGIRGAAGLTKPQSPESRGQGSANDQKALPRGFKRVE